MFPDPNPAPQPPDYEPGRTPTPEIEPSNTPEEMPDPSQTPIHDPAPDVGRPQDVGSALRPDEGDAPPPLAPPAPWPDSTPRP